MDKKLSNDEFWKLMDVLKYSDAEWPKDTIQTPREVVKSLTWRRKGLWNKKNYELRDKKSLREAINVNVAREQKTPEQQVNLWKDRPRMAKEEIPNDAFQILQKQHSVGEDDS